MYVLKYFDNSKSIEKQKLFFQLHNDKVNVMVNWSKTYALGIKLNLSFVPLSLWSGVHFFYKGNQDVENLV